MTDWEPPSTTAPRTARRAALAGFSILLLGLLVSLPINGEVIADFTLEADDALIIRPWMRVFNLVVNAFHAVMCCFFLYAAIMVMVTGQRAGSVARVASASFVVAMLLSVAAPAFDMLLGPGPFLADDDAVPLIDTLVFAPGLARTVGLTMLCLALGMSGQSKLWFVAFGLMAIDFVAGVVGALIGELGVIARLHAAGAFPWLTLAALAGTVTALVSSALSGRGGSPGYSPDSQETTLDETGR